MELNLRGLENKEQWEKLGYKLPEFDEKKVKQETIENPEWIHFGAGNIFRAFQANVVQILLNKGILNKGLIVAEGYDDEIIEKAYKAYDNYGILVTLKADGTIHKTVIGSIIEALSMNRKKEEDFNRLKKIFIKDSLKMVSFTITEKGYSLVDSNGKLLQVVEEDMINGPTNAESYMGKVASLLYERFLSGRKPIALVSMDNCSHNGDKLRDAVTTIAYEWMKNGLVDKTFLEYVQDPCYVTFPWTMIDKITPRPDETVKQMLEQDGIENLEPIITAKNTYVAPFVNAEEMEYLVIEDAFPNGKVALEQGGIIYTDRATVDQVEKMKVCTCLNPLHTTLAIFGCLLGYKLISEEMKNSTLKKLVELIGYKEGLPVVADPKIIRPEQFIKEVLEVRIPNPFMPDTPQRIATDTSQKLGIRFGETIKAYVAREDLNIQDLKAIPLVFAGWLRYLMAIDDQGNKMVLSPDPMLNTVCTYMKDIQLGEEVDVEKSIRPILEMEKIFGINLYTTGLGIKVEEYFKEMVSEIGAVERTLIKVLSDM